MQHSPTANGIASNSSSSSSSSDYDDNWQTLLTIPSLASENIGAHCFVDQLYPGTGRIEEVGLGSDFFPPDELHPFLPLVEQPTIDIIDQLLPTEKQYEFVITEYEPEIKPGRRSREVPALLVDGGASEEFSFYDKTLNELEFELYAANALNKPEPFDEHKPQASIKEYFESFAHRDVAAELQTANEADVKPSAPIALPTIKPTRSKSTTAPKPEAIKPVFRCPDCASQFVRQGNLRRHQQNVHCAVPASRPHSSQPHSREVSALLVVGGAVKEDYDKTLNELELYAAANAVTKHDPFAEHKPQAAFNQYFEIFPPHRDVDAELQPPAEADVKSSAPIAAPTNKPTRSKSTAAPKPEPIKPVFQCPDCASQFQRKGNLQRHQKNVHCAGPGSGSNSGQQQLICNNNGFACPECDRTFRTSSTLQQHRVIHSDERPHQCEACGRAFNRISTLIAHRRTHQPVKQFSCHLCPKAFHQKGNLRNHIFMHTNERPYRCGQCDKGFNQLSNLNVHRLKAHGISGPARGGKGASAVSAQCQRCGDLFASFEQMRAHEVRVHRHQLVPMKTIDLTDDDEVEAPAPAMVLLQPKVERTDPPIVPLKTVTPTTSEAAESCGAMPKLAMPKLVAHEQSQSYLMGDNLKTTLLRASLPNTVVIERKPNASIGRTMTLPKSAMLRTSLPAKLTVPEQKDMVSVSLKTINLTENQMASSSTQPMLPIAQHTPMAKLVTLNTAKKELLIPLRQSTNLPNITVSPLLIGGVGVPQRMPHARPLQQLSPQAAGSTPTTVSRPQNLLASAAQLSPSPPNTANTTFIVTTEPNIANMQFIMPAIRSEAMHKVRVDNQIPYVRLFMLGHGAAPTVGLARISEHSDPRCHQLRYVPFEQLRNGNGRVLVPVVADLRELNAVPTSAGKVMRTFLVMPPKNDMRSAQALGSPAAAGNGGVQTRVIIKTMSQLEPTASQRPMATTAAPAAPTPSVSMQMVRSEIGLMPQSTPAPQLPHVSAAAATVAGAVPAAKRQRRQPTAAGANARPVKVMKTQRKTGDSLVPPPRQLHQLAPPTPSYLPPLLMARAPTVAIFGSDVRSAASDAAAAVTVSEHEYRSLADNRNDDISLAISDFATGQLLSPPRHCDDAAVGSEPMDVVPPLAGVTIDYENLAASLSQLHGQYELDAAQQKAMHLVADALKSDGYEPDYDNIATCIALHYY